MADTNNFPIDPIRAFRNLYCEKFAPLAAAMDVTVHDLSEDKLEKVDRLFEKRKWNVDWQALALSSAAVLGGACQIGGGFAKSSGFDDLHQLLSGIGSMAPKGGEMASMLIKSEDILTEGELQKLAQHRLPEDERIRKNLADADNKVVNQISKLGQQQDALYQKGAL